MTIDTKQNVILIQGPNDVKPQVLNPEVLNNNSVLIDKLIDVVDIGLDAVTQIADNAIKASTNSPLASIMATGPIKIASIAIDTAKTMIEDGLISGGITSKDVFVATGQSLVGAGIQVGAGTIAGTATGIFGTVTTGPAGPFEGVASGIVVGVAAGTFYEDYGIVGDYTLKNAVGDVLSLAYDAMGTTNDSVAYTDGTNYESKDVYTDIDFTSVLGPLGYDKDATLTDPKNAGLFNSGFIVGDDRCYIGDQNQPIFTATNDTDYSSYVIVNDTDSVVFKSSSIANPGSLITNDYMNVSVNLSSGSSWSGNSSYNESSNGWLGGTAASGYGFTITMPPLTLNGDGFFNVYPSDILTDQFRPGAKSLTDFDIPSSVDELMDPFYGLGDDYFGDLGSVGSQLNSNFIDSVVFRNVDPLILDLNGDGIKVVRYDQSNARFDIDMDQFAEQTGWVSPQDGILVQDKNGNGKIDDISETFSEYYTPLARNGFEALKTLDSNNDNRFDSVDGGWSTVRVWRDANGNGVTDAGELITLESLGIKSISLVGTDTNGELQNGNLIETRGSMTLNDGSVRQVASVDFLANPIGYNWQDSVAGAVVNSEGQTSSYVIETQEGVLVDVAQAGVASAYGNVGDDKLVGDAKNNWLGGGGGSDTLLGGDGDDMLIIDAEDKQANIDGGNGFNVVLVAGDRGVSFNLAQSHIRAATGGGGSDLLVAGGNANVFINGGAGNDILVGGGADDVLNGEDGNDVVDGAYGDDVLRGHRGNDTILGNFGNDVIEGGAGNDRIEGGSGQDLISGNEGNDTIDGGSDYDIVKLSGSYADYKVAAQSDGSYVVTSLRGNEGTDVLRNVEALSFKDINNVTININNPMPVNDVIGVTPGASYTIGVSTILGNDIDYQNNPIVLNAVSNAVGGTVVLSGNNLIFTPTAGFNGVMSFRYTIKDSQGNKGLTAAITGTSTSAEMKGTVYVVPKDQPQDPLYVNQWYMNEVNVQSAWKDYSGKGVKVGVFDPGLADGKHVDLDANVTAKYPDSYDISAHATMVAGIIGAERNNEGAVGIASGAHIDSWAVGNTSSTQNLSHWKEYDVVNNSWGFPGFFSDNAVAYPGNATAFAQPAQQGRNGLGTIVVTGSGNERTDGNSANYSSMKSSPYMITVSGINKETDISGLEIAPAPFSNPGSSVLVSAPASNITSTSELIMNDNGSVFGTSYEVAKGTSFATPIVSGVVALMLEANPNLGYRDVRDILAYCAKLPTTVTSAWKYNASKFWNGGGMHNSLDYGYGEVDALAAVRMAESWRGQETFANLQTVTANSTTPLAIAGTTSTSPWNVSAGVTVSSTLAVSQSLKVEDAQVTIDLNHPEFDDLIITLVSPSGTETVLMNRPGFYNNAKVVTADADGKLTFTFDSVQLMGEKSVGNWTLKVQDVDGGPAGTINSWSLKLLGGSDNGNDTYVYTNEFSTMTGTNRTTLTDASGTDTINASAVTANSSLNLAAGSTLSIGGKSVVLSSSTMIENAAAGDGNDTILGNDSANWLFGGRGSDSITGGKGEDSVIGGDGNDTLSGDRQNDTMDGGRGDDMIMMVSGYDYVTGGSGADVFVMQINDETKATTGLSITNNKINDMVISDFELNTDQIDLRSFTNINSVSQLQISNSTINSVSYTKIIVPAGTAQPASTSFLLAGVKSTDIKGAHFMFAETTAMQKTAGNDNVIGTTGHDTIDGMAGNDTIDGGQGNDSLMGGDGNDSLIGNDGDDVLHGGNGLDTLQGNLGNDVIFGEWGNDILRGGQGNDTLCGGAGDDELYGDKNDDVLYGNSGNDKFFVLTADGGRDTIFDFEGAGAVVGDVVYFTSSVFATAQNALDHLTYANGNAIFDLGNNNSVTLMGVGSGLILDDVAIL